MPAIRGHIFLYMKILFSADWHIKLGQKNVPVEWQKNRYLMLFENLEDLYGSCDLQIVGGDIFDRVPTLEELELFFRFVHGCTIETLIYSGNHEAVGKYTTFFSVLKQTVQRINSKVRIVDEIEETEEYVIIPYNQLKKWVENYQSYDFNAPLCFTHVRGEIPPHVSPEINLELFDRFKCVFAGDLHSHSNSQRNIVYPGSPLTTSFHRSIVQTGCIVIDTDSGWDWVDLGLPQLLKLTVTDPKEMVKTDFHHTVYELHGDMMDLSNATVDLEFLDKKVVRTTNETSLILTKDMTLEDELSEYLLYIVGLDQIKVNKLIKTYHDHIQNIKVE